MNYGNRNASSTYTSKDIGIGYSIAVASSIAVAMGLRKLLSPYTRGLKGGPQIVASALIAYCSVSSAGFLNAFFMRKAETKTGIDILDQNGTSRGKSPLCAKKAVK